MKNTLLAGLAGAVAIGLAATPAAALTVVSFNAFAFGPAAGETLVTGFEGGPALADITFAQPGYGISGSAALLTGSSSAGAAPGLSTTDGDRDPTQYLSVELGQTATASTPLLSSISFYVGSLDGYNRLTFVHQDGTTELFTGAMLDALPFVDDTGAQQSGSTNGRLHFVFDSPITGFTLGSDSNSFEISTIYAALAVVPEPHAWALLIMGFGGVGALMRARRRLVPEVFV